MENAAKERHLSLKKLSKKEICDLYQENPYDEEVDLQLWLSMGSSYYQRCDFNIPLGNLR